MKKLFILLSLITLCSCGQEKTITPQRTNFIEAQETEQKEDVMSEAEYKGKCKEVTFKELSEDKDAMKGDMLTMTGEVVQVKGDFCRFNVTKTSYGYDNTVAFTFDSNTEIKENDVITVWGDSEGFYTYTTVIKDEVTVPKLKANYIEVNPLS